MRAHARRLRSQSSIALHTRFGCFLGFETKATSMFSALPSVLDAVPSTSGRHCQAPAVQAKGFGTRAPRTAAFSAQVRNRKNSRGHLQTLCAIKKKTERCLVCSKTLTVKPDNKDAVMRLCQQVCYAWLVHEHLSDSKSGQGSKHCCW